MNNPLLAGVNNGNLPGIPGKIQQIKNNINTMKALGNPNAALNMLVQQNPMIQKALQYVQQNGGDPKTAMEKLCIENGIDPHQIYNALK